MDLPASQQIRDIDSAAAEPAPGEVIEAKTDIGPIYLERDANLVTPYILEQGSYGPELSALLRDTLRPGMTFVDAGANIGYLSVLASKLVGERGRVFSVEPFPLNQRILAANLARHGCTNATILPVAAWSERAELSLVPNEEGGAGIAVTADGSGSDLTPAARLDELIDGSVDVLKVDCESNDHMVVAGAAGLIDASPSMLVTVEFFPTLRTHSGHTAAEVIDSYRGLGLRPYEIQAVEQVRFGREPTGGLRRTSYRRLLEGAPPGGVPMFDFALSRKLPDAMLASRGLRGSVQDRLPARMRHPYLADPPKALVERAGDLLDYIPARWRPPIRRRDRRG